MQTWPLDTNAEGRPEQRIVAPPPGQYRLSYRAEGEVKSVERRVDEERSESQNGEGQGIRAVAEGAGDTKHILHPSPPPKPPTSNPPLVEGGYLFTVVGKGYDVAPFRFNPLELVPDKLTMPPAIR